MSTTYLLFLACQPVFEKALGARAYIVLNYFDPVKAWDKKGEFKGNFKAVSVDCGTYGEVEGAANLLIEELKAIKRQAKIFFQNEKGKRVKRQPQHLKNNGK